MIYFEAEQQKQTKQEEKFHELFCWKSFSSFSLTGKKSG